MSSDELKIGTLPAAYAVVFFRELNRVGQVRIAGAFPDHGICHQKVDGAGIRSAGHDFHQRSGLIGHRGVIEPPIIPETVYQGIAYLGYDLEPEAYAQIQQKIMCYDLIQ